MNRLVPTETNDIPISAPVSMHFLIIMVHLCSYPCNLVRNGVEVVGVHH